MKILILCTGNSCRSQMAEGVLKSLDSKLEVYSAGTAPANSVNDKAIIVMKEINIDISQHYPKSSDKFRNWDFDYVITVCDNAAGNCPVFSGNVKEQLHIGFDDPFLAKGSAEEQLNEFRRVRDEIVSKFKDFYINLKDGYEKV